MNNDESNPNPMGSAEQAYRKGSDGPAVRIIQEWLCFHRIWVALDGRFGAATDAAVRFFQEMNHLAVDGIVGPITKAVLIRPLNNAMKPIAAKESGLSELTLRYALQHSQENPREIGGSNRGPWVRLYMKENEGTAWPWCAGFVSYMLEQAARTLKIALPFATSFSCDLLAAAAHQKQRFLSWSGTSDYRLIKPGSLFLLRGKKNGDWVHTGVVVKAEPEVLLTVEGNTNGDGSVEGIEVWRLTRNYQNKDFILV